MKRFKVGDKVYWESQAAGSWKRKEGVVVGIIPIRADFRDFELEFMQTNDCRSAYGGGMSRDHESYAVLASTGGKMKPVLYWPRVGSLHSMED